MKKNLKNREYYEKLLEELYSRAIDIFSPQQISFDEFKLLTSIILTRISLNSLNNDLIDQLYLNLQQKFPFIQRKTLAQLINLLKELKIIDYDGISMEGFQLLEFICLEDDN
ncbi:MAG: hypothetical protein ACTSQE_13445 [Candidatus Heimdallarchaeaceae archaeon]